MCFAIKIDAIDPGCILIESDNKNGHSKLIAINKIVFVDNSCVRSLFIYPK